jgi:2,3-bisphosphoglycerate-independent phosphoglycerate mutase
MNLRPLVFVIMDGVGITPDTFGNAVAAAYTPTLDYLMTEHPNLLMKAHGTAVGLPSDDDMGNSEVGHNALGCGQIYAQGAKLVNASIEDGSIFESDTWKELVDFSKDTTMHFIGLLSDGNVHSNIQHTLELVSQAKKEGIKRVRLHTLLDGRDVPAKSALIYVDKLEAHCASLNDESFDARIASGGGRMLVTMDRYEAEWGMVELGWKTHVLGEGPAFTSATEAIESTRAKKDVSDQYIEPFVIVENGVPVGRILDHEAVVLTNFRGDRAIEISKAFDDPNFDKFDRKFVPIVKYAGMLQYDGDLKIPNKFLVNPPRIKDTLTEHLLPHGIRMFAISETQKFGHVTYFWNGNKSGKFSETQETFVEVKSDLVPFDERPWMKSAETTDIMLDAIRSGQYDFLRINYPNGDMVGHTGSFLSTQISVEAVDLGLERLKKAVDEVNGILVVVADHGNADEMYEPSKDKSVMKAKTAHTLNPVPFIVYGADVTLKEGKFGLANVAASLSELLGIEPNPVWEESMIKSINQ